MERLLQTVKAAWKNVIFNKKQYIYFAILIMLVQSLISCVILFNHNNIKNEIKYLEKEYYVEDTAIPTTDYHTYHIVMSNMTDTQHSSLVNKYSQTQDIAKYFHPIKIQRVKSGSDTRYNIYVYFESAKSDETPYQLYKRFYNSEFFKNYLGDGNINILETPLLLASRSAAVSSSVTAGICVAITALGVLMFTLLFNTVVNHFKFSYGIYMTFGANFKKLLGSAFCEMLIVNLLTFVPSFLFSILITYILTLRAGFGISILIYPAFLALLCSLIMTTISVVIVIKKVSRATPDKLIKSVNNVGLISSPRISSAIPFGAYPVKTELLSMKRFRKYVVGIILSTLIFAGCFCGGAFAMQAQRQKENAEMPQFELVFPTNGFVEVDPTTTAVTTTGAPVTSTTPETTVTLPNEYATGYTYTAEVRDNLYSIDGVKYIVKERYFPATTIKSHILVNSSDLKLFSKLSGVKASGGYRGFANVNYALMDEEVIDNLRYYGYTITGDINSVLSGENVIAISDSFNNTQKFSFKVGDKIKIATGIKRQIRRFTYETLYTYDQFLEAYLHAYEFEYEEFTIGAIISDMPVGDEFPLYMNSKVFERITGADAYFANIQIICDEGLSEEEISRIALKLETYSKHYLMTVTNTCQETTRIATTIKNYPGIILYVSALVLLVSLLIWSLSQSLFYLMRKQELDIYMCLGASFKEIKKLFLFDGAFFTVIAAVFYSIFALIANYASYKLSNISIGNATNRFAFSIPIWAYLIGLLISMLAAFLTVMNAYRYFKSHSAPVFTGKNVDIVDMNKNNGNKSDIFDSETI